MDSNDKPRLGEQEAPAPDASTVPRGSFELKKVAKNKASKQTVIIVGGVLVLVVLLLIGIWSLAFHAMDNAPEAVDESSVEADPGLVAKQGNSDAVAQYKALVAKQEAEEKERQERLARAKAASPTEPAASQQKHVSPPVSSSQVNNGKPAEVVKTPKDRKLDGSVVVVVNTQAGSSHGASSTGRSAGSEHAQTGSSAPPGAAPEDSELAAGGGNSYRSRGSLSSLSRTPGGTARAYLAPDGKYLLRNNTYARCALYTEVITEHESRMACYLVSPLYSSDGSTLIADAGARMTGEQRIEMKPGQAQVFTQWNDLEVESGQPGVPSVRAQFAAMGTGPMGSSGTKGWIDNKTLERYGGAIVLTGVKDLLQALSNTTQRNGGSGYTINNSEQNVEDMATKTLDANININPVGYLLPGTIINVTIARDIDFSPVYENR